jgi:DNA invertase Pin-like site-specific DNA recombinase
MTQQTTISTTTLRYILYLRKSTDRDDMQALSIEGQRNTCLAYASSQSIVIVDTVVEHRSAKSPGRPLFGDMLRRIENGEADAILAYHPNRLARNSKDGGELIYWLDTGTLKDLRFPTFWFENTPQGKSMLGIEFAQSKRFSDDLAIVTKRGLTQKCLQGLYPGNAPRGYLNDRRTKMIQVDRPLAPIIREVFERYAAGTETVESLRYFLKDRGIVTRKTQKGPGDLPVDENSVRKMLSNPIYYGSFIYAGVLYEGKHEPIITKDLFDQVQRVVAIRVPTLPQAPIQKPFTRLIRCGGCGMSITSEVQKGYTYYRCSRKSRTIDCKGPYLRAEALDTLLSDLLVKYSLPEHIATTLTERFEAEAEAHTQGLGFAKSSLQQQKADLSRKLEALAELYLNQQIDRPTYVKMQNELQSEITSLKAKLTGLENRHVTWLEPVRKWISTAQRVHEIARNGVGEEKRRVAINIFGSNLALVGQKLVGRATKPWEALAVSDYSLNIEHVVSVVRTAFGIADPVDGGLAPHATTPVETSGS